VAAQLTFLDSPREFALRTIHDVQSGLEAKVAAGVKDRAAGVISLRCAQIAPARPLTQDSRRCNPAAEQRELRAREHRGAPSA